MPAETASRILRLKTVLERTGLSRSTLYRKIERGTFPVQARILDDRSANAGSLDVQAIDARADWPVSLMGGLLRVRGDATYNLRNRAIRLFQPTIEHVGYLASPLRWRANGGAEWSRGNLLIGANLQYFAHYLAYPTADETPVFVSPPDAVKLQGSAHIPSQSYLDLYGSWRVPAKLAPLGKGLTLDVGIINVFDKAPGRRTSFQSFADPGAQGLSPYGDPRRRRFEVALTTRL